MPRAIRFWATSVAASCAPSTPPASKALPILFLIVVAAVSPRLRKSFIGTISSRPTGAAYAADMVLSSSVAPAALARSLAVPADAPTEVAPAKATPGAPKNEEAKRGTVEPTPSPNFPPSNPSSPGSLANGDCSSSVID